MPIQILFNGKLVEIKSLREIYKTACKDTRALVDYTKYIIAKLVASGINDFYVDDIERIVTEIVDGKRGGLNLTNILWLIFKQKKLYSTAFTEGKIKRVVKQAVREFIEEAQQIGLREIVDKYLSLEKREFYHFH